MRKLYSTIAMLAMMVTALSFIGCGSNDDEEESGESPTGKKTLTIDGQSYYCCTTSSVEQTNGNGMYFQIDAGDHPTTSMSGRVLIMRIVPSRVSELKVGDVFDEEDIYIRNFATPTTAIAVTYNWFVESGDMLIKEIKEKELTIQLRDFVIKLKGRDTKHTIEGTATLYNSLSDSKGNMLPFSAK